MRVRVTTDSLTWRHQDGGHRHARHGDVIDLPDSQVDRLEALGAIHADTPQRIAARLVEHVCAARALWMDTPAGATAAAELAARLGATNVWATPLGVSPAPPHPTAPLHLAGPRHSGWTWAAQLGYTWSSPGVHVNMPPIRLWTRRPGPPVPTLGDVWVSGRPSNRVALSRMLRPDGDPTDAWVLDSTFDPGVDIHRPPV